MDLVIALEVEVYVFDGGNADSWSIDADTSTQVFLWLSEIREHQERVEMFKELETRSEMLLKQLEQDSSEDE